MTMPTAPAGDPEKTLLPSGDTPASAVTDNVDTCEKTLAIQIAPHSGTATPRSYHPQGGHGAQLVRERLRHFLHPNGKRIHVAASPEEAVSLRNRLSSIHATQDDFDITISGTPEHLDALRTAQLHHQDARDKLREQHPDVYDRFDKVHSELDTLALELDRVATHGLSLDAHFDRFGYNARVRSYDDDDNHDSNAPTPSGARSPRSSISSDPNLLSARDSQTPYERGFATPLKIFKVPTLRQYFHKGILWRARGCEEVQSFELFVDLLYVGILQILGDHAAEHPTALSLLHLIITFTLAWKIWNDMCLLISWFETDDVLQRIVVLFLLAALFGYTTNTTAAFPDTYPTLIGFYLAARFMIAGYLLLVAFFIPMIRPIILGHVLVTLLGIGLWIASIHVPWPNQLILIFLALFVDLFFPVAIIFLRVILGLLIGSRGRSWFDKTFEFIPAINIEHRTERTNAFVSLVFGFSVVALLYQSAKNGIDAFFGKAILGLIQIFCFNWLYFEIDSSNLHMHAIRRHKFSALVWSFAHLPFILSFVLAGGGLAKLVIAYDFSPSSPSSSSASASHSSPEPEGGPSPAVLDHLTDRYRETAISEHLSHVPDGLRWFYCAGLALSLLLMGTISLSHIHRTHASTRLRKRVRLAIRGVIAIIILCLPLAHQGSLHLVSTVTGLIVCLLMIELAGTSDARLNIWGRDRVCKYTGRCGRGQLLEVVRSGKNVDVDGLAPRDERYMGHTAF